MTKLKNKIILVAGGAGEVGEGITRQFLIAEAKVIVTSRNEAKLNDLRERLGDLASERLVAITGQIGDEKGATAIRDQIITKFGRVDHVVASLGGWWQGQRVTEISLELWHRLLDNSLTAHFITARTFIPLLQETQGSYTLINGGGALHPVPRASPVSTSAAAQVMFGRVLAAENGPKKVRVNNLILATPIITRARPTGQPGWLSADDAGRYCVTLAAGTTAAETIIFENVSQLPG